MKLYYPITVDLYNLYPLKKMDAQQDNTGRGALVTLTAAGMVIAPTGETVTLWAKKPDGMVSYLPCTVADGKIKADFTNQMLAIAGSVQVELQMVDGENNITTPIFTVEVHPSNIDDDAVESQNEFTALVKALQEVEELKENGLKGDPGKAATISIGTVTASAPGGVPAVTNSGTEENAVFDFVIPRGEVGPEGPMGPQEVFFGAFSDFPTPGNPDVLYVDTSVDPRLLYNWDSATAKYVLAGGAGGADGSSIDIPLTLPSTGWTGTAAPYSQTVTVPQMREDMTPLLYFSGSGDAAQYAYSLITGYEAGYAQMTFSAADKPQVDIPITLKGIPAQQLEFANNTVVVVVSADGFTLNEDLGRYEKTIPVAGMVAGAEGGGWDIIRSGPVLTEAESKIALSITDVEPLEGAIKIVCLWPPEQQYMLKLVGTYTQVTEGSMLLAGMQEWFDKVDQIEADTDEMQQNFNTVRYQVDNAANFDNFVMTVSGNNIIRHAYISGYNSADRTLTKYGSSNYYIIGKATGINLLNAKANTLNTLGKYYIATNNPFTIKTIRTFYCIFDGNDTIVLVENNVFPSGYINALEYVCFI